MFLLPSSFSPLAPWPAAAFSRELLTTVLLATALPSVAKLLQPGEPKLVSGPFPVLSSYRLVP